MEGPFEVYPDGTIKFEEKDGIDYDAVAVQLPGGERVPFLFTIKQLVASGKPESFSGGVFGNILPWLIFLGPKDIMTMQLHCLLEEKETKKSLSRRTVKILRRQGKITLSVTKTKPETGEVIGEFESVQPSGTDLGAKAPKDVKMQGIWYGQLES